MKRIIPFSLLCVVLPWGYLLISQVGQFAWVDWISPVLLLGVGWPLLVSFYKVDMGEKGKWFVWIPLAVVVFALWNLTLLMGYKFGWSSFTYGSIQMSPEFKKEFLIKILPLGILAVVCFEWVFRQLLWQAISAGSNVLSAWILTSLLAGATRLPLVLLSFGDELLFRASLVIILFSTQFALGALKICSGRILPGMILHLLLFLTGSVLMNDILGGYMTLMNYSSSSSTFYYVLLTNSVVVTFGLSLIALRSHRINLK